VDITPATIDDFEGISQLLQDNGLPVAGLFNHLHDTLVARSAGRIVGSAAIERYGHVALLRSVAVDREARGSGLGRQLTEAALRNAMDSGVRELYLLTTTAEGFFPRFGFEVVGRDAVPAAVLESVEFTSACPASARVMRKILPAA
jgi:amino-acid N-acetyltransferase